MRNLQLCKAKSLEYIKEISGIRYKIKNYNNKAKYKAKNKIKD